MTKSILACVVALALTIPSFAGDKVCIKVDGMSCGACASKVTKALAKLDGVSETDVSAKQGTAQVTLAGKTTKADVMAAINKTGFKAVGEQVTYKVSGMTCGHCEGKVTKALTALDGVTAGKVCSKSGSATAVIDAKKSSAEAVEKAIVATGFKVVK